MLLSLLRVVLTTKKYFKLSFKFSHSVMSKSVRPHRWQPTRLPCPWDSPGKNTGVGCHFLLPCMKVKSESEVAQSCLTRKDPIVCSLPGSSVHGIFQARVLEWGAIAFSTHTANKRQNPRTQERRYCEPIGLHFLSSFFIILLK